MDFKKNRMNFRIIITRILRLALFGPLLLTLLVIDSFLDDAISILRDLAQIPGVAPKLSSWDAASLYVTLAQGTPKEDRNKLYTSIMLWCCGVPRERIDE